MASICFADNGRALVNPGMGWTMHFYSGVPERNYNSTIAQGDSVAWFPGCSTVYLRIPWAHVEPEEGRFNWNALDTPAQRWIERGGQVAFRITCSEPAIEYATPKWVFDAGARAIRYRFGFGEGCGPRPDGKSVDPDYADPVFLDKLDAFLAAFAARYDGRPEVAFVDVGSYGTWGEGHTHGATRVQQEKTDIDARAHIDLYRKHFKRTFVAVSDDLSGWNNPDPEPPLVSYARSQGLTWRDDSIMVQAAPKQWYHAAQAERFWRTTPVILEHQHYAMSLRDGAWDPELLVRAVEEHHASFMSIHGNPRDILEGNRDAIDRINRRIGYRFVPESVEWPDTVVVGENAQPFDVRWRFRNAGVAPAYRPCHPCLTVKDAAGAIVAVLAGSECDLSKIGLNHGTRGMHGNDIASKEHKEYEDSASLRLCVEKFSAAFTLGRWVAPLTLAGDYDVWLSVGEADGTPRIALPVDAEDDGHRRYRCGKIRFRYADGGDRADFDVRSFGAVGDGRANDTPAIQAALDAAAAPCAAAATAQIRRVVVPPGTYLTGSLRLGDDTELHLMDGAVLLASPDLADYNALDAYPQNFRSQNEGWGGGHLVYAVGRRNVSVTGKGVIDGNGRAFFDPSPVFKGEICWRDGQCRAKGLPAEMRRPGPAIAFVECAGVAVRGVHLRDMPCWSCLFHGCESVAVSDVRIRNGMRNANTDGLDVDSCRHVSIERCDIETGDDAIAIRANPGRLADRSRVCEDIVVRGIVCRTSADGVRVGVGTGAIRNVRVSDLEIRGAGRGLHVQCAYGAKPTGVDIRDVSFERIAIRNSSVPVLVAVGHDGVRAALEDIRFSGIRAETSGPIVVAGNDSTRIRNVRFEDCTFALGRPPEDAPDDDEAGTLHGPRNDAIRVERADDVAFVRCTLTVQGRAIADFPAPSQNSPRRQSGEGIS